MKSIWLPSGYHHCWYLGGPGFCIFSCIVYYGWDSHRSFQSAKTILGVMREISFTTTSVVTLFNYYHKSIRFFAVWVISSMANYFKTYLSTHIQQCMHAYNSVCTQTRVYARTKQCTYTYNSVCTYTRVYAHIQWHMHKHNCVCTHTTVYAHTQQCMHTYNNVCTHTTVYAHTKHAQK
jgi:hypothetical protein